MSDKEKSYTRICSFYVSDLHLVTMLLPYISEKIKNGIKFETILEKSILEDINLLISKINLKKETDKKIHNINWNKCELKENEINNYFEKIINSEEKAIYLIVRGEKEYIEKFNKKFENFLVNNKIENKTIKVINCFDAMKIRDDINEILEKHEKVLNTSGEKLKEEVFTDYRKDINLKKAN